MSGDDPLRIQRQADPIQNSINAYDQKIAMNTALSGLSNTERYQLENPTNAAYKPGAPALGSAAEASMAARQNDIMQTVRGNLAEQQAQRSAAITSPWVGGGTGGAAATAIDRDQPVIDALDKQATGWADWRNTVNARATKAATGAGAAGFTSAEKRNVNGIAGFANGGSVETAEQLMARMAAKYGTTGAASAPDPTPAPVLAQAITQEPQQRGIINLLKNRGAQIDKAVNGYANGGKIVGPGTSTSDSIPGEVVETKEPIKVSTKERIVSKDQDVFLEGIAAGLGYRDLNALLEAGTGKPVGPTIKHGKRSAQTGMVIDELGRQRLANLPSVHPNPEANPLPSQQYSVKPIDFTSQPTQKGAEQIAAVRKVVESKSAQTEAIEPGAQERTFGSQGAASASPAIEQSSPVAPSGESVQQRAEAYNKQISEAQRLMQLPGGTVGQRGNAGLNAIARSPGVRDTLNAAHASIGDGISFGVTRGADGKPQTLISGTAPTQAQYISADGKPTSDWRETRDYADAQERNAKDRESASRMERERLERNTRDDITNPSVKAWALANLDRMNDDELLELKRQAYGQQAITAGLDQQTKRLALGQATDTEALRKKVISGDPVAAEQWKVLNNRDRQDVKIATEEVPNPDGTVTKIPYAVYGNQTSRRVSDMAGSNATPRFSTPAELEAAKRAGKIKAGDIVSTPNGNIRVK